MADNNIAPKLNQIVTDPDIPALLELKKKELMLMFNCHALGTIQAFDEETQTAQVSINYQKSSLRKTSANSLTFANQYTEYPVLADVPVVSLMGGDFALTMPVKKGDFCILMFNDRDINNWMENGISGPLASNRLHSLADGIALVGLRPYTKPITNFATNKASLRYGEEGNTEIAVTQLNKIRIANEAVGTLNTLLQNLITQINALITQTAAITVTAVTPGVGVSGPPANAAAITAVTTQLTTIATQIGQLLE